MPPPLGPELPVEGRLGEAVLPGAKNAYALQEPRVVVYTGGEVWKRVATYILGSTGWFMVDEDDAAAELPLARAAKFLMAWAGARWKTRRERERESFKGRLGQLIFFSFLTFFFHLYYL